MKTVQHLTDEERQVAMEFVERVRQQFDGQLFSLLASVSFRLLLPSKKLSKASRFSDK